MRSKRRSHPPRGVTYPPIRPSAVNHTADIEPRPAMGEVLFATGDSFGFLERNLFAGDNQISLPSKSAYRPTDPRGNVASASCHRTYHLHSSTRTRFQRTFQYGMDHPTMLLLFLDTYRALPILLSISLKRSVDSRYKAI